MTDASTRHRTCNSDYRRTASLAATSCRIERGEVFGAIGFSGAGKSTLLRLVEFAAGPPIRVPV